MSTNTALYFADAAFPRDAWDEVLSLFEFELRAPEPQDRQPIASPKIMAEWIVRDKGATIGCSLSPFRGAFDASFDAQWTISTDGRRSITDLLAVANLAYATLSYIPNAMFHDLNGHICRTPQKVTGIYIPYLESLITPANFNKLFEAGIVNYDGKLCF